MATYSSILPWKNPCPGEPGGLQSMGLQRVRHDWTHTHTHTHSSYSFFHKWRNWGTERFIFSQESCLQTRKTQLGLAKAITVFFGRFLRNSPIPQKGRWPGPEHRQEPREAEQTKQGHGTSQGGCRWCRRWHHGFVSQMSPLLLPSLSTACCYHQQDKLSTFSALVSQWFHEVLGMTAA